ncbi:hypothetical protein ACIBBE_46595 [Streptomyces sp. NPDC051644]
MRWNVTPGRRKPNSSSGWNPNRAEFARRRPWPLGIASLSIPRPS